MLIAVMTTAWRSDQRRGLATAAVPPRVGKAASQRMFNGVGPDTEHLERASSPCRWRLVLPLDESAVHSQFHREIAGSNWVDELKKVFLVYSHFEMGQSVH